MRTPTRKLGKYAHLAPDPNMTENKYRELKAKLKKLKENQPGLIEEVTRLALMGDFSENAAYQIAKGRLRGLNQKIFDINKLLGRANIIQKQKNSDTVQLGSFVAIEKNHKQITYQILGSTETDPNSKIISNNSPLGAALMGRRVGDTVEIKGRAQSVIYKIISLK